MTDREKFFDTVGILLLIFSMEAHAQDAVRLSAEVIPADTCALMYDMSDFKGSTLLGYFDHLDSFTGQDGLFFLFSPALLSMYKIDFVCRKACLSDLLNEAVAGKNLAWECRGNNILIWRL
jgi:hypothetical protein